MSKSLSKATAWIPLFSRMRLPSRSRAQFEVKAETNPSWPQSKRGRRITVARQPVLKHDSKIFAIGSCFAREIRVALRALDYDVYPKYFDLKFDPSRQQPNMLPRLDNINHYDTFVIRQEIERAIARRPYDAADFWQLALVRDAPEWSPVFCDPYRRKIYAADMESLVDLSTKLTHCIADGLAKADIAIITLGLTECWRNRANGLYVCDAPGWKDQNGTRELVEFHPSTFAENYENMAATIDQLTAAYPDLQIVLTVSPVALHRTWTSEDVVVANMTSKTTLRAVAGQICRDYPNVIYWPSYEFALSEDIFEADGRHVAPENVQRIVSAFLAAHRDEADAV